MTTNISILEGKNKENKPSMLVLIQVHLRSFLKGNLSSG